MEWYVVLALVLATPIMLIPVAVVMLITVYPIITVYTVMREKREKQAKENETVKS